MKSATTKILLLLSLPFLSWTAVVAQTLTATSGAPEALDGVIGDGEWTSDSLVTNAGVTLYAMGDGEYLYLAAHWADATESVNKRRWQFDGATWERGPEDEDRIAFIWDMGLNGPNGASCLAMCHDVMRTNTGFVDVWHWKAARGNAMGYVDDQYMDTENRKNDPGKSAYVDNNTEAGGPAFMASGDPGANVDFLAADAEALAAFNPFGTLASHTVAAAVPFDGNAAFEAGHTIPWYLMRPGEGDRGSVQAAGKWEDGRWTVEFKKPYAGGATGKVQSEFDFDVVPGESIEFTHEIFDNIGDEEHAQDGFDFTVYTLDMTGLVSTATELLAGDLPASYALRQNYPNPFNPSTEIEFQVPGSTHATLAVYDLLGKRVATLADEDVAPGAYRHTFHGAGLPTGVYFYRLETSVFVESRMMTLLK